MYACYQSTFVRPLQVGLTRRCTKNVTIFMISKLKFICMTVIIMEIKMENLKIIKMFYNYIHTVK